MKVEGQCLSLCINTNSGDIFCYYVKIFRCLVQNQGLTLTIREIWLPTSCQQVTDMTTSCQQEVSSIQFLKKFFRNNCGKSGKHTELLLQKLTDS